MTAVQETPEAGARRLAATALRDGFEREALHEYTDNGGVTLYWRIRLKNRQTGEKWIRPMRRVGARHVLGEPEFREGKPLYGLHLLARCHDGPVIVTEGEFKADKLAALGLTVTTSGGADSAAKADWTLIAGREVLIWPDNDNAGQLYAGAVTEILTKLHCTVRVLDVVAAGLVPKGDAADWLAMHPDAAAADVLALACMPGSAPSPGDDQGDGGDDEGDKRQSQASTIVAFVEERALLFHNENSEAFAQDKVTLETRRLESRQFRDWLVSSFYLVTGKSPREQSVREALATLAGLGRFRGECLPVHVRVAQHEDAYFLDLGEQLIWNIGRWHQR